MDGPAVILDCGVDAWGLVVVVMLLLLGLYIIFPLLEVLGRFVVMLWIKFLKKAHGMLTNYILVGEREKKPYEADLQYARDWVQRNQ